MNAMGRVLVTGGGGFIGTHWCRSLAARQLSGVVLDCNAQTTPLPANWTYVRGDVRDVGLVHDLMATVSRVVHLAAAHHDAGIAAETYTDVNVHGTRNVLAAMSAHGLTDLVFTSSVAVFGDNSGATERTAPSPESPYGITKLAAERLIDAWVQQDAHRTAVVLRPAVVIGTGHFANMYSLMKQIDSGLFVQVGAASNIKSLSAVRAVVEAGEWMRTQPGERLRIANVVSDPQQSSAEIIGKVSRALGKPLPRLVIPRSIALSAAFAVATACRVIGKHTSISVARVKKLFETDTRFEAQWLRDAGFTTTETTTSAIAEMAEWYRAEGRSLTRQVRLPSLRVVSAGTAARLAPDTVEVGR